MKKTIIFLMVLILLSGCHQQQESQSEVDLYLHIKQQLLEKEEFDDADFHVQLVYNDMEDGYRYDVVIDQPSEDMYHIIALCYNEESSDEVCPSLGIFDSEEFHLKRNYIKKDLGFYKGIQLSGKCQKKNDVLLYICYYTDENQTNKIEKYIKVVKE